MSKKGKQYFFKIWKSIHNSEGGPNDVMVSLGVYPGDFPTVGNQVVPPLVMTEAIAISLFGEQIKEFPDEHAVPVKLTLERLS